MKVLIPIYPTNSTEVSLLKRQVNDTPLGLLAAKELCLLRDAEVHVFTTGTSPCNFSSYPIYHHRKPLRSKEQNNYAHLPLGTRESIEYIKRHSNNLDETVLVVDYRTTNISIDLISKAHCTYLESPKLPLLSVHAAKDNPAQFQKYYRIISMDILSVIEKKNRFASNSQGIQKFFAKQGPIFQTKPIPFNWIQYGYPAEIRLKEFFARFITDTGYCLLPVQTFKIKKYLSQSTPELYFKESRNTARRVLQIKPLHTVNNSELHTVSAFNQDADTMCLITKNMDEHSYQLFLHENCWAESDLEIRMQPFSSDMLRSKDSYETTIHAIPKQRPVCLLSWHDSIYNGPVCTFQFEKTQPDGFVVSVLSRHIGENADFAEAIPLSDFCSYSPDHSQRINKETGLEITGRQTCPDFYQPNGAFVFSRLKDLLNLEQEMLTGKTRGYLFDCTQIRSEFDARCMNHFSHRMDADAC